MFLFLAGASMDGIFNNCGVEVKCPSSLMNADLNKLTEKQLKKAKENVSHYWRPILNLKYIARFNNVTYLL